MIQVMIICTVVKGDSVAATSQMVERQTSQEVQALYDWARAHEGISVAILPEPKTLPSFSNFGELG
jgi:hypothetical protein